ncbi:STAS-like domain-containing protein [Lonepinella sp. BR2357]|uniref:STAS-like domain-containing protein n=1 Tax=Lonepinella sp. BR2357 TaxID=3434549 RepID=UPI003F6E1111
MTNEIMEILQFVKQHPTKTAEELAQFLGIARQNASRKLRGLVDNNLLSMSGRGRATRYDLVESVHSFCFDTVKPLDEYLVFSQTLQPLIKGLNNNVVESLQYGFTEMFNNAIDHSEGTEISVEIRTTPISTFVSITDNGLGIFEKIQKAFDLVDIRQSIFELSKGKLTTDSKNHTGEGIFFSSKIFDFFCISSKGWAFVHNGNQIDVMYEHDIENIDGTKVMFEISHLTEKTCKEIFDEFAMPDEFSFAKTIVPINLAKHEGEFLISRSQAKRLVARFEHFQIVILDFAGVSSIGQAFADQLFRVYQNEYPNIELISINANLDVQDMINRAILGR